jgi:hypothetical protein
MLLSRESFTRSFQGNLVTIQQDKATFRKLVCSLKHT